MTDFDTLADAGPGYLQPAQFVMPQAWQTVAEVAFMTAAIATVCVDHDVNRRGLALHTPCRTRGPRARALDTGERVAVGQMSKGRRQYR